MIKPSLLSQDNDLYHKIDLSGCYHPDLSSVLAEFEYILYTKYKECANKEPITFLINFIRRKTIDTETYQYDVLLVTMAAFNVYIRDIDDKIRFHDLYRIFNVVMDLICFDNLDPDVTNDVKLIRVTQAAMSRSHAGCQKPHNKSATLLSYGSIKPISPSNVLSRNVERVDILGYRNMWFIYDIVSIYLKMNPFVMITTQKAHQKAFRDELSKRLSDISKWINVQKPKCGDEESTNKILEEVIKDSELFEQIKCFLFDK